MYNRNVACIDNTYQTAHKHSRIRTDCGVLTKLQELKWSYYRIILYVKGKVLEKGSPNSTPHVGPSGCGKKWRSLGVKGSCEESAFVESRLMKL